MGRRGQYILEYAILIGIVVAALTAMSVYIRRSAQGGLKLIDDEYSESGENWK